MAVSYRVTTIEQLHEALEDARKQTVSTLMNIKVLPKTMVRYLPELVWRVGGAQVSRSERIGR